MAREASRDEMRELRVARARSPVPADMASLSPQPRTEVQQPPQIEQVIYRNEALARLRMSVEPAIGFGERLVLFWSNHFCVSVAKGQIARATAARWSARRSARTSSAASPTCCSRSRSIRPCSSISIIASPLVRVARRPQPQRRVEREPCARDPRAAHAWRRRRLHAGGRHLARPHHTGWSFVGAGERLGPAGSFVFVANRHEPGEQLLLGKRYSDTGVEQGETALRDIARHPATATHVARKLVRHLSRPTRAGSHDRAAREGLPRHRRRPRRGLPRARQPPGRAQGRGGEHPPALGMGRGRQPLRRRAEGCRPAPAAAQPSGPAALGAARTERLAGRPCALGQPEGMRARLDLAAVAARRIGDRFQPTDLAEQLFDSASRPRRRRRSAGRNRSSRASPC